MQVAVLVGLFRAVPLEMEVPEEAEERQQQQMELPILVAVDLMLAVRLDLVDLEL